MPKPYWFLRYRLSAATRNFTSGRSDVYVLAAAATRGFTSSSAVAKRPRDASYLSVVSFIASIVQYLEHSFFYYY